MDIYPIEYIQHPFPVLGIQGLDEEIKNSSIPLNNPLAESLPEILKLKCIKKIKELLGVGLNPSAWESSQIFHRPSHNVPYAINPNPANFANTNLLAGTDRLFNTIFLDKDYKIPFKVQNSFTGMNQIHSPLSPFSASSPLHPDGLITPLWLNKHYNELPSAILSFYELWYPPELPGEDNNLRQFNNSGQTINLMKEKDAILSNELNEIRKAANDASIKFVVVIWDLHPNQRELIEDRVTQIRKGSGLESKTEFFLLTRTDADNLGSFLSNVQKAIYESSLHYYRDHYRLAKKKLSRVGSMAIKVGDSNSNLVGRPLSSLGWTTRYEFKLGVFSLIRQEFHIALRHFDNAYSTLSEMMMSSEIDITNKKRWLEAKLLIEAINFHICRLYLYSDMGQSALTQLNRHVWGFKNLWKQFDKKAPEFRYERSAWFARQYKSFAELLECGIRFGKSYIQPIQNSNISSNIGFLNMNSNTWKGIGPRPTSPSKNRFRLTSSQNTQDQGIHPLTQLQHPGYYFYEAACHLTKRYTQFKLLKEEELIDRDLLKEEDEVDHTLLIIEALSKAYEQFKKYKGGRMTLWVASEIADTYSKAGKYDLALKFYERIAKTFRNDHWPLILQTTLQKSIECITNLPDPDEPFIRYTIELLSPSFIMSEEARADKFNQLLEKVFAKGDYKDLETKQTVIIEMDPFMSFIKQQFTFKESHGIQNQPSTFQLQLQLLCFPENFTFTPTAIKVHFDDPSLDFVFINDDKDIPYTNGTIRGIEFKHINVNSIYSAKEVNESYVPLSLNGSNVLCLQASISPLKLRDIKATCLSVHITTECWDIVLKTPIKGRQELYHSNNEFGTIGSPYPSKGASWLTCLGNENLSLTRLKPLQDSNLLKVHPISVESIFNISHPGLAYLDEIYPVNIKLSPLNEVILNATLSLDLGKSGAHKDEISLDSSFDKSLPGNIEIGNLEKGSSKELTVYIKFRITPGLRTLHFLLSFMISTSQGSIPSELKTSIKIETTAPVKLSYSCIPQPSPRSSRNDRSDAVFPDGMGFLAPNLNISKHYLLITNMIVLGPKELEIMDISINGNESDPVLNEPISKVLTSSFTNSDFSPLELKPDTPYILENLIEIILKCSPSLSTDKLEPWSVKLGQLVIKWRRYGEKMVSIYSVPIPTVSVPSTRLLVELEMPNIVYETTPFSLIYTLHNLTSNTEEIIYTIDLTESPLALAGSKKAHLRLLPHSSYQVPITCHSLANGKIRVPGLVIQRTRKSLIAVGANQNNNDIEFGWNRQGTFLWVMPQHAQS